jgi:hypothetical protein
MGNPMKTADTATHNKPAVRYDMDKLIKWLEANKNGSEVFRFDTGSNSENIAEARDFAEKMRKNLGKSRAVNVVQSYNRVELSLATVGALSG